MTAQDKWEDKAIWQPIRKLLRECMTDEAIDRIYDVYHPLTKEA